jgi:hypothetical protein
VVAPSTAPQSQAPCPPGLEAVGAVDQAWQCGEQSPGSFACHHRPDGRPVGGVQAFYGVGDRIHPSGDRDQGRQVDGQDRVVAGRPGNDSLIGCRRRRLGRCHTAVSSKWMTWGVSVKKWPIASARSFPLVDDANTSVWSATESQATRSR